MNYLNNCTVFIDQIVESQTLQTQYVGKQFSKKRFTDADIVAEDITPEKTSEKMFDSKDAKMMFTKLQKAGLLDEDLYPNISLTKAALLAFELSTRLNLETKWAPFEQMWGIKQLRVYYDKAMNFPSSGNYIHYIREILDKD